LYLCPDSQSKIQRIIIDQTHPLRETAIKFLEFRIKVTDWCDRLEIPLLNRASKSDTFNATPPPDKPELSKEWDWINQEIPLAEDMDLSTDVFDVFSTEND
jgi:hypothetical protein